MNATFAYMRYRSLIYGENQVFQTSGTQRIDSLSLDRLLYRNGVGKTFAGLSLSYKSVNNAILGAQTEVSSPKLAVIALSIDDIRRLLGGVLHTHVKLSRGLHMWGARDDRQWPSAPKAQFFKEQGDLSYAHPVRLWGRTVTWTSSAHGQWTRDPLYSVEQIAVGGEGTVAGYRDQILARLIHQRRQNPA